MAPTPASPSDTLALTDLPELGDLLLRMGKIRLRIASRSMVPTLRPGDEIVVEPVLGHLLEKSDLVLFQEAGRLICHRVAEVGADDDSLVVRGNAPTSPGQRIAREQVMGKVVRIRRRTLRAGFTEALRALAGSLGHHLLTLQRLRAYRLLMRPVIMRSLSYHLGVARGARWYEWHELTANGQLPRLPPSSRSHLLIAKRGRDVAGWSEMTLAETGWLRGEVRVRRRYRGVGLERDLGRLADRVVSAR